MNRTKTMFFAFIGKEPEQKEKISEIQDSYEFWNFKKQHQGIFGNAKNVWHSI